MSQSIEHIAQVAAQAAADKKAKDIVILNIQELTPMADYFVIVSANSGTQVEAVARAVEEKLEELGHRCRTREGLGESRWVLLDFGDIVVHIFRPEDRDFYNIERLWGDAGQVEFQA